ncbi:phosphate-regulating neutral endopeptidase [Drosophila persimilis]|uniref:phosphate-regulating neutral endopeptidase n=1 Tax=Drosophila persimilis TaxID=7234 RepID=UPI000F0849AF|nr:phosphate-regulating neutral endopeptidase [Drosophila persimilis]
MEYSGMRLMVPLLLLAAFSVAGAAVTHPFATNYTNDILRLAKAAHIKAYMGEDPDRACDNFYDFACGNWPRLHPARIHNHKTNYLEELQELYIRKSADMLKSSARSADSSADRILKNFFNSCCLQANDTRSALTAVLLEATDFRGGWPEIRVPSWYQYEYDWLKVVATLKRQLGVDIFIGLDVIVDYKEEHMHRIKLGAPALPLGQRRHYLDGRYQGTRDLYRRSIQQKLMLYFPEQSKQWLKEVSEQVLGIEEQLAQGLPHNAALTLEQTTRQRTAADMKSAYGSYVDISRYLQLIFSDTLYVDIYETPEDYLSNLVDVIRGTPKLHLANYTIWRTLDFLDAARIPQSVQPDIWCIKLTQRHFPQQLESLFHRNYNNMQMINELQSTWTDIKRVFREDLQASERLHWLSQETRQKAISKLESLQLQFRSHDDQQLIRKLHGLQLQAKQFYPNLLAVLQWETQRRLAKLMQDPVAEDRVLHKLPHYELKSNKIQVPITFLQARFFWDPAYPNALKYGTLGVLLARQMLHGFDGEGRRYDAHGYQNNWWDYTSESSYARRSQCFQEQYAIFVQYREKPVQDKQLLRRIVADNGALDIAYRAYTKWLKNSAETMASYQRERLPLLDYSNLQLFYLAYAQLYCSDYPDTLERYEELPEQLRINAALSNSQQFTNAYSCPSGSALNARFKCTLY